MCAVEWTSLEVGKWLEANGLAAHKTALVYYCQIYASSWEYVSIIILSTKHNVLLLLLLLCVPALSRHLRSPVYLFTFFPFVALCVAQFRNFHVCPTPTVDVTSLFSFLVLAHLSTCVPLPSSSHGRTI